MKEKKVADSLTHMTELVLPNDANTHGTVLGGKVMHLIDLAGAIAAYRHCRKPVVTVSLDSLRFLSPVKVGQVMNLEAVVTRAFTTSMEIKVTVESEDLISGEKKTTCSAFLTFVALDEKGQPSEVPRLRPVTDLERTRYRAAADRRAYRLSQSEEDEVQQDR